MEIKCIAIDDEPLALDLIKQYASKISFLKLIETFENPLDAIQFLSTNNVSLIFLDVQMEELSGIQFLKVITNKPKVIMTTAYDKYAITGFELDVVDYLLKPISFERFVKAVNKVYDLINLETKFVDSDLKTNNQEEFYSNDSYFFVKTGTQLVKINYDEILYIEGQGDYLSIVLKNKKILTLQTFSKMEKILPENLFIRVHKSYIVSLPNIEKIERNRIIIGDKYIPISDSYKEAFYKKIESKGLL